jgi:hypothetical protein
MAVYTFTNFDDPLGMNATTAQGINGGLIVGDFFDIHGEHGFVDSGGIYTTIDDPLATKLTEANGINATG